MRLGWHARATSLEVYAEPYSYLRSQMMTPVSSCRTSIRCRSACDRVSRHLTAPCPFISWASTAGKGMVTTGNLPSQHAFPEDMQSKDTQCADASKGVLSQKRFTLSGQAGSYSSKNAHPETAAVQACSREQLPWLNCLSCPTG